MYWQADLKLQVSKLQQSLKNLFEEIRKTGRGIKNLRFFQFADIKHAFAIFSRREKILVLALAGILLLDLVYISGGFYINHTEVAPAYGGSFTEGAVGAPRLINPIIAQTQTDKDLSKLVYSGLYKYAPDGKLIPDLAASDMQISQDQHVYTIKLKPNLKWQDGQALTADDVIFTIQLIQNPDYRSPYGKLWSNITAEKVDDLTIKLTNTGVSAPFVTNLAIGILPRHKWLGVTPDNFYYSSYNIEPVGSGPYFIKQITKTAVGEIKSLTLNSFSNYALGKPFIDAITMRFYDDNGQLMSAFHTREIDTIGFSPFDGKVAFDPKNSKLQTTKIPLYEYQALFFNLSRNNALADPIVRQALSIGLNRTSLINDALSGLGLPAYTPILPGQIGYDPASAKANNGDPNTANAMLDQDGWAKNQDGIRVKGKDQLAFTITTNDFDLNQKTAQNLQKQWQALGAKVDISVIPTADLANTNLKSRDFEALLFAESTGYDPDPFVFWHSSQNKNPGFNLAQYTNSTIDNLITDARTTFNLSKRAADYKQFQNIFSADMPAIILDQSVFTYQSRQNILGINTQALASPEDRFYDVNHWYIQTKRIWK